MNQIVKRLLALLLTAALLAGVFPGAFAAEQNGVKPSEAVYVYTEADNTLLEQDVFARIDSLKTDAAMACGGIAHMTEQDYIALVPQVVRAVETSDTYVPGTLRQNGYFLVWETTVGIPCCYDPRMEAELHNTDNDPTPEEAAAVEAEAQALLELADELQGGGPYSPKIGLIQPYWESSSNYADSSFNSYSPHYKTVWQNLANATGGQAIRYSMTNATVDNIADTMEQCGLVIFDSHGTTDYSGSGGDYTSRANCSYLCLTTNAGVTSQDTVPQQGEFGTYYHCMKGSGYAYVSGTCIANHMDTNAPHSLLYMGICLGMATDGMYAGLRAKDVEVVYGYSQSVTFSGELQYIQSILGYVKDGDDFGTALGKAKNELGNWDPAYSNYSEDQARANYVAFPITVSSEDVYPGHGNVDAVQRVHSTWSLFGVNYDVQAVSNNTEWGTVSVNGSIITAHPISTCYAVDYEVISGSATVTQDGNSFWVNAQSDCVVQINFAPKPSFTLSFTASGIPQSSVNALLFDEITLPDQVSVNPEGWDFCGWAVTQIDQTNVKPAFYAPGAAYTVLDNVDFYALFVHTEVDESQYIYELADRLENGGKYVLVDDGSISGSTGYAVGNTIVTSNHYLSPVSVGVSGERCTPSAANLGKVLWTASGSDANGYTFYNEAVGKYMGLDASEYLAPTASGLAWTYTEERFLDNRVDSEGYYYLSYSADTTVRYTTSKSGSIIHLFRQRYAYTATYWTDPIVGEHTHSLTHVEAQAPTCGAAGNSEYWRCTVCGKLFSDADGEQETTLEAVTLPATGLHTPGSWTSNQNGTHSRTCSVCSYAETANCAYDDDVTPPTPADQGYTTHTCTVCGYSYKDTYVPALGYDYTVHFSVPAGLVQPADMVSNTNTGITLPTVAAPEGYAFLGWVTAAYDNVTLQPAEILTGTYVAPSEITLLALFRYRVSDGSIGPVLRPVTEAAELADGDELVIRALGTDFALYQQTSGTSYVKNYAFTEDAEAVAADARNHVTLTAAGNGSWYLGDAANGWLYSVSANNLAVNASNKTAFTMDAVEGGFTFRTASGGRYLACRTDLTTTGANLWRLAGTLATTGTSTLQLYKLTEEEVGTNYYTTVFPEPHVHSPADPVRENEVPPTCTQPGSYDLVVYCTACGAELERQTVPVQATGHNYQGVVTQPTCTEGGYTTYTCANCQDSYTGNETNALGHLGGDPVVENRVEPTEETEGGYDTVVYCVRCRTELSRTHTVLPAVGWSPCNGGEDCPGSVFTDMAPKNHWAHDAIDWAYSKGITSGTNATTFSPNETCTREQVVTFLWNAMGKPEPETTENPFSDVKAKKYYYKAVLWAYENHITSGLTETTFGVGEPCTREQVVTFLWNAMGKPEPETTENPFSDVKAKHYFCKAVLWAYENGVTGGVGGGKFGVGQACTRAQIVTFLYKTLVPQN